MSKKKQLCALAVVMVLSLAAVLPVKESQAYGSGNFSVTVEGVRYSCFSDKEDPLYGTAYVYGFDESIQSTVEEVTFQSQVKDENGNTYKVTEVGGTISDPDSVSKCAKLKKVVIPDSVTKVGAMFRGCPELTTVVIPDSVTVIEEQAFIDSPKLTGVHIPENPAFTRLEAQTFNGCKTLTDITIPKNVTYISGTTEPELSAFDDDVAITLHGYIDSAAETFADARKNITFAPLNGISHDLFRVKFPDSWVGKYVAEAGEDGDYISVTSKKAYDEKKGGGWLFSIGIENYGWYDDIFPSYHLISKKGSMNFLYCEPTDVQMDSPENGFAEYGYSQAAIDEYKELGQNMVGPTGIDIRYLVTPPATTSIGKIKRTGKKAKVTVGEVEGVSGYEIEYSNSKKFPYMSPGEGVKSSSGTTLTATKLKKGKTYYVRVRTYITVGKSRAYSAWSKTKTMK